MDFNLKNKVAVVAGGSRGCGLAVSEELAMEGAAVVLTGRNSTHVSNAVSRIEAAGGKVRGLVTNMVSQADARNIIGLARETFGAPDILVVNPPSPSLTSGFESIADEEYIEMHEYYVMSLVRLLREVVPAMKSKAWGRVVSLASIGVKTPHLHSPMYHQNTRVAVPAIIKTLSYEYAKYNITANTIAVGSFTTELSSDYRKKNGLTADSIAAMHPMGRSGRTEELAAVVAFLCSERASYVSGETIRVDGGMTHNLF